MDQTSWSIIGALAGAVAGEAGFIVKLYADLREAHRELKESQEARIAQAEEHHRELLVLKGMIEKKRLGGTP